jgi:hypothetical protein
LTFSYNADLVATLKRILREARSHCRVSGYPGGWLSEHKKWFVEPAAWPFVRRRLEAAGCTFIEDATTEEDNDRTTAAKPAAGTIATLEPVLRQWYHQMALRFHPDRGGSNEAMQIINYANDALRRLIAALRG